MGLVSGAILSNTLSDRLSGHPFISDGMLASLTSSTYDAGKLGLSSAEMDVVLDVYMEGLRYTFILYTVCTGVALLASLWIGHRLLKIPMGLLAGMVAGIQTQPAALGFALEQSQDELPNIGYAAVFPIATITKIIAGWNERV